jgi:NTP pyrophosphatase (non-canonical NTP hydrolase)
MGNDAKTVLTREDAYRAAHKALLEAYFTGDMTQSPPDPADVAHKIINSIAVAGVTKAQDNRIKNEVDKLRALSTKGDNEGDVTAFVPASERGDPVDAAIERGIRKRDEERRQWRDPRPELTKGQRDTLQPRASTMADLGRAKLVEMVTTPVPAPQGHLARWQTLTASEYQNRTAATAIYPGQGNAKGLMYCALKLNGEAGEIAEHVGKAMRDEGLGQHTDDELLEVKLTSAKRLLILKEVGDVAWYLARICTELGEDFGFALAMNLDKLAERKARGALGGSGDDR